MRAVVQRVTSARVLVGDRPVRSAEDAEALLALLRRQQEYYRASGTYQAGKDRLRVQELFDRAIEALKNRRAGPRG